MKSRYKVGDRVQVTNVDKSLFSRFLSSRHQRTEKYTGTIYLVDKEGIWVQLDQTRGLGGNVLFVKHRTTRRCVAPLVPSRPDL